MYYAIGIGDSDSFDEDMDEIEENVLRRILILGFIHFHVCELLFL